MVPRDQYLDEGYGAKGCMCEYFLRTPEYVLPALDNVSDEEAVLVEPMAVSINAVNWASMVCWPLPYGDCPHFLQNSAPSILSVWHFGHIMVIPPVLDSAHCL